MYSSRVVTELILRYIVGIRRKSKHEARCKRFLKHKARHQVVIYLEEESSFAK